MIFFIYIGLLVLAFLLGVMCNELENDRFEKALCENLKELKEIHEEMERDDADG